MTVVVELTFKVDDIKPDQGDQPDRSGHGLRTGACPEPASADAKTATGKPPQLSSATARHATSFGNRNAEPNASFRNGLFNAKAIPSP